MKILYGVVGESMGHATRSQVVLDELCPGLEGHEITILVAKPRPVTSCANSWWHLRGPVIVLWDNGKIHRGDAVRAQCKAFPRSGSNGPPYAPELNPDEGIGQFTKRTLANGRPDDINELQERLHSVIETSGYNHARLRECIRQTRLLFFVVIIAFFMQGSIIACQSIT